MKTTMTIVLAGLTAGTAFAADPLVSSDWVADNPEAVVLDIRTTEVYLNGHIPGAVNTPYAEGWRSSMNGIVGQLPHQAVIEQKIAQLGVDQSETVVIVAGGKSQSEYAAAARVYWTFKVLGHEEVSILNGGFADWKAQKLDVATDLVIAERGDFSAQLQPNYLVDASTLAADLEQWQTVDARPLAFFEGKDKYEHARVGGTIPESVNLVHASVFENQGAMYFADADSLKQKALDAGVDLTAANTATFCNTGHLGSTDWFVLSELVGVPNTALFDGSMTEWTADENRPVQTAKRGLGKLFSAFGG